MAQKVQVLLTDDLDGTEAEETMEFALDGVSYEIDLSADNAEALRSAVQAYVEAARRTGGRLKRRVALPRATPTPAATNGTSHPTASSQTIRAWAASQPGIELKDRGRIPAAVIEAFNAANPV